MIKLRTVWKYKISLHTTELLIPKGGVILHFDIQGETPCIWVLVDSDPSMEKEVRNFMIFGTGHSIREDLNYKFIGSALMLGGALVWHLFEVIGEK